MGLTNYIGLFIYYTFLIGHILQLQLTIVVALLFVIILVFYILEIISNASLQESQGNNLDKEKEKNILLYNYKKKKFFALKNSPILEFGYVDSKEKATRFLPLKEKITNKEGEKDFLIKKFYHKKFPEDIFTLYQDGGFLIDDRNDIGNNFIILEV